MFWGLLLSSWSFLVASPLSMALFLVFSVIASCFNIVFHSFASSWLGYLLVLLFVGGVLVVLLILTSLSGPSLLVSSSWFLFGSFFIFILLFSLGVFSFAFILVEPLSFFVFPVAWVLGFLGCFGCLMFLVFLGFLFQTSGSIRNLIGL